MLKKTVITVMLVSSFVSAPPGPWNLSPDAHSRMAAERLESAKAIETSLKERLPAVTQRARNAHAHKKNLVEIHRTHARIHTKLAGLPEIEGRAKRVAANRGIQSLFNKLSRHHGVGLTLTKDPGERAMHSTMRTAANQAAAGTVPSPERKGGFGAASRAGTAHHPARSVPSRAARPH